MGMYRMYEGAFHGSSFRGSDDRRIEADITVHSELSRMRISALYV